MHKKSCTIAKSFIVLSIGNEFYRYVPFSLRSNNEPALVQLNIFFDKQFIESIRKIKKLVVDYEANSFCILYTINADEKTKIACIMEFSNIVWIIPLIDKCIPTDLSFDLASHSLYWSCHNPTTIQVADVISKKLIGTSIDASGMIPTMIGIISMKSLIVWVNEKIPLRPTIERSTLNGMNRVIVWESRVNSIVEGLIVDQKTFFIYWFNKKTNNIESIDYNGKNFKSYHIKDYSNNDQYLGNVITSVILKESLYFINYYKRPVTVLSIPVNNSNNKYQTSLDEVSDDYLTAELDFLHENINSIASVDLSINFNNFFCQKTIVMEFDSDSFDLNLKYDGRPETSLIFNSENLKLFGHCNELCFSQNNSALPYCACTLKKKLDVSNQCVKIDTLDDDKCPFNTFPCLNSNQCIELNQFCDKIKDCFDYSDEAKCECSNNQYKCISGSRFDSFPHSCINNSLICNHINDCLDGSDERECPYISVCYGEQFSCKNGKCIDRILYCDGIDNCGDSSDEIKCNADTNHQEKDKRILIYLFIPLALLCMILMFIIITKTNLMRIFESIRKNRKRFIYDKYKSNSISLNINHMEKYSKEYSYLLTSVTQNKDQTISIHNTSSIPTDNECNSSAGSQIPQMPSPHPPADLLSPVDEVISSNENPNPNNIRMMDVDNNMNMFILEEDFDLLDSVSYQIGLINNKQHNSNENLDDFNKTDSSSISKNYTHKWLLTKEVPPPSPVTINSNSYASKNVCNERNNSSSLCEQNKNECHAFSNSTQTKPSGILPPPPTPHSTIS